MILSTFSQNMKKKNLKYYFICLLHEFQLLRENIFFFIKRIIKKNKFKEFIYKIKRNKKIHEKINT